MNRANFGNVVTNGMQILSVAGTTSAAFERQSRAARIADASSALNNMSEDELHQLGQMRADKLRSEISRYNASGESPYQHLSDEEAGLYQAKRADQIRKFINQDDENEEDVDSLMSGAPFSTLKSPQADALRTYIKKNFDFSGIYVRDKSKFRQMTREDLIKSLNGGDDTDADV